MNERITVDDLKSFENFKERVKRLNRTNNLFIVIGICFNVLCLGFLIFIWSVEAPFILQLFTTFAMCLYIFRISYSILYDAFTRVKPLVEDCKLTIKEIENER